MAERVIVVEREGIVVQVKVSGVTGPGLLALLDDVQTQVQICLTSLLVAAACRRTVVEPIA